MKKLTIIKIVVDDSGLLGRLLRFLLKISGFQKGKK